MSYDTTARKKAKPAETQVSKSVDLPKECVFLSQNLIPDTLRAENVKIEGQLTKFNNN